MALALTEEQSLIEDIASKLYKAKELMLSYGLTRQELLDFRDAHIGEIEVAYKANLEAAVHDAVDASIVEGEPPSIDLNTLWITKKSQRIQRYQDIVEELINGNHNDATSLREIRSYMSSVAEELGQLPNRGSATDGEETKATYEIVGVDPNDLR